MILLRASKLLLLSRLESTRSILPISLCFFSNHASNRKILFFRCQNLSTLDALSGKRLSTLTISGMSYSALLARDNIVTLCCSFAIFSAKVSITFSAPPPTSESITITIFISDLLQAYFLYQ